MATFVPSCYRCTFGKQDRSQALYERDQATRGELRRSYRWPPEPLLWCTLSLWVSRSRSDSGLSTRVDICLPKRFARAQSRESEIRAGGLESHQTRSWRVPAPESTHQAGTLGLGIQEVRGQASIPHVCTSGPALVSLLVLRFWPCLSKKGDAVNNCKAAVHALRVPHISGSETLAFTGL